MVRLHPVTVSALEQSTAEITAHRTGTRATSGSPEIQNILMTAQKLKNQPSDRRMGLADCGRNKTGSLPRGEKINPRLKCWETSQ